MALTTDKLSSSSEYKLVRQLHHDEIIDFLMQQLKQLRWPMAFFYGFNIMLIALIISFTAGNIAQSYINWSAYFLYLLLGLICGMVLVIPVHEILHGIAYKLIGATKVKYGADLKQMLFYASAPGFVAGKRGFYLVALTPFAIINLLFLAGIIYGHIPLQWGSLVAFFTHSTMCIGDFAMINYMASFHGKEVYTFDDKTERTSYFYIKDRQYPENCLESRHLSK
jgi:hypothetical protein